MFKSQRLMGYGFVSLFVSVVVLASGAQAAANNSASLTYDAIMILLKKQFQHGYGEAHFSGAVEFTGERCGLYIKVTPQSVVIRLFGGSSRAAVAAGKALELEVGNPDRPRGSVTHKILASTYDPDLESLGLNSEQHVNYMGKYSGTKQIAFIFQGRYGGPIRVEGKFRSAMRGEGLIGYLLGEEISENSVVCILNPPRNP